MTARRTIEQLLADGTAPTERMMARIDWVHDTTDKWRAAQREMDERCDAAVGRISEEEFERLCDEEEAKVDAFRTPVKDAAERDVWPREMHFHGV